METLFGISQYKATEYPFGTTMEMIASANDFIIKRIESRKDYLLNYRFDYKILNKHLELHVLKRNGWTLGDFQTNHGWEQAVVYHLFRDNTNNTIYDCSKNDNIPSFHSLSQTFGKGNGKVAINLILEKFLKVSEFIDWKDYLKKKHDINLDYLEDQYLPQVNNPEIEIISLKEELEKLKFENAALKAKLEQIETIIGKDNRILQKPSKKPSKKS